MDNFLAQLAYEDDCHFGPAYLHNSVTYEAKQAKLSRQNLYVNTA